MTMNDITTPPANPVPTELDDQALSALQGGTRTYTGGRFQLDIGKYSVGYLRNAEAPQGAEGSTGPDQPAR